jgi:hypothetical protein
VITGILAANTALFACGVLSGLMDNTPQTRGDVFAAAVIAVLACGNLFGIWFLNTH